MTSRHRLQAAINHRSTDRICVDFGAGGQTGIGVCSVHRLRQATLRDYNFRVKVTEPYQMLGEIDEPSISDQILRVEQSPKFARS